MHRWKLSALAAAAALSAGLYTTDASALALGRVTVQSALGEPLRAEIDLPQITPAESESLRATLASPEVFRAQGFEYTPTLNGVRVALQRRADGSMVLRLNSDRPINDPFVDLVIDASWNSGHIVRSYTMLFDPPATRRPAPAVTASPQVTAPPAPTALAQAPAPAPAAARPPTADTSPVPPPAVTSTRPAPAPRPAPLAAPAPAATRAGADSVTVRPGDTAGRIASANRPAGVSLDQMLVAMMRANPDAFVNGNVNRLRSGAVLQLPDQVEAQTTPPAEARQIIAAQSRDFNEFRRRLAAAAPPAAVAAAGRSASGSLQSQVEDRKPATAAPDKLTLSKGGVQAAKADEQLAKDKQASDSAARMAELNKNIAELNKLNAASAPAGSAAAPAPAAAASPAAPAPGVAVPVAAPTPAAQSTASAPAAAAAAAAPAASTPASPATAGSAASPAPAAPAAAPASPAAVPPADPAEEPGFVSTLLEEPLLPGVALALILALLGYAGYRAAQRRRAAPGVDSSFMESRAQPDSFFGSSGGQRVDTAHSMMTTGSSMAYSPSQLDTGGDVDPVAEADVYLAYGRDLQAEEILKEAARHHPDRVAIHAKLADIYAKRQDRKAFEVAAQDVLRLTDGQGAEWQRVADIGRTLDPDNALYQPGARPSLGIGAAGLAAAGAAAGFPSTLPDAADSRAGQTSSLPPDLDLDLDLDLPDDALTEAPPAAPAAAPSAFAMAAAAAAGGAAGASIVPPQEDEPRLSPPEPELESTPRIEPELEREATTPAVEAPTPELDFSGLDLPDADWPRADAATQPAALSTPSIDAPDFAASDLSMLDSDIAPLDAQGQPTGPRDFDLGDLSLDLDTPTEPARVQPVPELEDAAFTGSALPDDPLATKLALAEEFNAIGDSEGARTLIEEVIAESSGELKTRAQRLLSELG